MSLKPGIVSGIFLLLGISFLIFMVSSDLNGMEDLDDDGINDQFQDIRSESEFLISSSGEIKEVEIGHSSALDIPYTLFMGATFLVIIPVISYINVSRRGEYIEMQKARRRSTVLQENIRRISAFISISPSIPRAVRLSHMSQSGDDGKVIGSVVWNSRVKGTTIEDELMSTAKEFQGSDPHIFSGMDGIIRAQDGSDLGEIRRTCELVIRRLSEDMKESMTEYSNSLRSPASALFAIGVLLPVLLATMIPIAGLSGKTVVMVGFLLWIGVPYIIMTMTRSLVIKRPLIRGDLERSSLLPDTSLVTMVILGAGVLTSSILVYHLLTGASLPLLVRGPFPGRDVSLVLLLLLAVSLLVSGLSRSLTRKWEIMKKERERTSVKIPDLLSEMGDNLMEGGSIERAVVKGYERISEAPPVQGSLDGDSKDPAANAVGIARQLSRSGGREGGSAVKVLSKHLREMARHERSLKEMVRSNIGQMETTASVIAPVMIGASVGIFELMGRTTTSVDGGVIGGMSISQGDLTTSGFVLLSGVYLLILSIVTTISLHRLEEGAMKGGWRKVPRNVALSTLMFTGGVFISTILFGG